MSTFGQTLINIVVTIISSTVNTLITVVGYVIDLFRIIGVNFRSAGPLTIGLGIVILAVVIYGVFKFVKGGVKTVLIIGGALLLIFIFFMFI